MSRHPDCGTVTGHEHRFTDVDAPRHKHTQFAEAQIPSRHLITDPPDQAEAVAARIRQRIANGSLAHPNHVMGLGQPESTLPRDHDDEVRVPTLEEVERIRVLRRTIRVERQRLQSGKVAPLKSKASRRTVPAGKVVIDALAAHLKAYPAALETADPALFVDEAHAPLSYRRWKRLLANAATASGVELTSHSFRHFAASALISGGASVKQVQTFLGHASAVITLRTYAHMWPGDEDRTRNVLDAALSPLASQSDSSRTVAAPKQRSRRSEA